MTRPAGWSPRLAALRAVEAVLVRGRSLGDALPGVLERVAVDDRALAQALAYGVLRQRRRLEAVADGLLSRPLRRRDGDVRLALLVGLYQLAAGTVPPHAAVAETAGLGRALGKPWSVRLLNATLRRFQRERSARLASADADPAVRHSLPDWLAGAWRRDWPDDWERLFAASDTQAPMTLRVNRLRSDRARYAEALSAAGLGGAPLPGLDDALVLDRAVPVDRLPGFAEGEVAVQDGAAQYAAGLVAPAAGERVLDACAAPGGKTAHLLALCPDADVLALDSDAARLERVRENLARLGHEARLVAGDAAEPAQWWDGTAFDRILLDAPCSATGVIRRHPDIKWLRRPGDIPALAATQARILAALWPTLARGGTLVYATCSVLRAENEAVIEGFLAGRDDAVAQPPGLAVGRPLRIGHQILPGDGDMDGFYYACLCKR